MPAALNRAQHHPDSMRPQRHCSSSPAFGTPQRCRSNEEIAVTQSRHSAPPTECRDYSAERCRGALERGGVPKRRRRPSSRNEPFVTLLMHIEMQPADQCNLHTHVIANKNKSPIEKNHQEERSVRPGLGHRCDGHASGRCDALSLDGRLDLEAVGAAEGVEEACVSMRSSTCACACTCKYRVPNVAGPERVHAAEGGARAWARAC